MSEEYLTLDEAALLLQINRETIEMWLEEGLPYEERAGAPAIRRSDLDEFLLRHGQGRARDAAMES
ncbi:MAG: helix-turn-helix domain-containing protein [Chloroflexota bacterium]